jgi:hypothetical protein
MTKVEVPMSNVIAFDQVEPRPPTSAQIMLRRLSRGLAILFTLAMALSALWLIGAFVFSFIYSNHIRMGAEGAFISLPGVPRVTPGTVLYSSQPFITHLAGFVDVVIAMTPVIFICRHLRGLFGLYASGIVFARENAAHLKRIGVWLVVYPFAKFAANMLFRLAGGTDKAWFRGELVDALILGVIVFAIAQVMEFGREIEQDSAEII